MEHSELAREMLHVEKLPTRERMLLAQRRRALQLEKWKQTEKERIRQKKLHPEKHKTTRIPKLSFESKSLFLDAASHDSVDEVRQMLTRGVSPDACNEDGLTALHQACINNNPGMAKLLLSHDASVNAKDVENWTPLHAAAACGHKEIIKILISHDADLLSPNDDGSMPYDVCENDEALDIIETAMAQKGITQELIEERRNEKEKSIIKDLLANTKEEIENLRDDRGGTLFHMAACYGYVQVLNHLMQEHPNLVQIADKDGWLPLHAAAYWRNYDVVSFLVHHGVDLSPTTDKGESVFHLCEDEEFRERLHLLKRNIEREFKRNEDGARNAARGRSMSLSGRGRGSVHRRSSQEKSLTPKKEAIDEAKVRLGMVDLIDILHGVEAKDSPSVPRRDSRGSFSSKNKPNEESSEPKRSSGLSQAIKDMFAKSSRKESRSGSLPKRDSLDDQYDIAPQHLEIEDLADTGVASVIPHRGTLGELKFGGAKFQPQLHADINDDDNLESTADNLMSNVQAGQDDGTPGSRSSVKRVSSRNKSRGSTNGRSQSYAEGDRKPIQRASTPSPNSAIGKESTEVRNPDKKRKKKQKIFCCMF